MKQKNLLLLWLLCMAFDFSTLWAQDSLNVTMVGKIEYWDEPWGLTLYENYLLVADMDAGLRILDVSNPASPIEVGSYQGYDHAFDVVASGDYAYLAEEDFVSVDISDPSNPVEAGHVTYQSLGHPVRCVAIQGNYAYLAGYEDLTIVDISNPSEMQIVGNVFTGIYYEYGICAYENYVYVSESDDEFEVYDVSDPTNPVQVSENYNIGGSGMAINGSFLFLAGEAGLFILSLAHPANPQLIEQFSPMSYKDIAISDDIAYLAAGEQGMHIVNISNPLYPFAMGYYDNPSDYCWRICAGQGKAYYSSYGTYTNNYFSGVRILDVSSPFSPQIAGSYYTLGNCYNVAVQGDYAYLANGSAGLVVVDISEPSSPFEVGNLDTDGSAGNIVAQDNFVYMTSGTKFYKIYIANPEQPVVFSSVTQGSSLWEFIISGSFAYVMGSSPDLQIYGIQNFIYYAGSLNFGAYFYATSIAKCENYVYLGFYNSVGDFGIQIIDVSIPSTPSLVGTYEMNSQVGDMTVYFSYLYCCEPSWDVIRIFSLDIPSEPALVGNLFDIEEPIRLEIIGGFMYAINYFGVVYVLDLADPLHPNVVGFYDAPGQASQATADDNYFYLADGYFFEIFYCPDIVSVPPICDSPLPSEFTLYPPAPNPFNPTTTIPFGLPVAAWVKVEVFDIAGRMVSHVGFGSAAADDLRWYEAGVHEVTFDGSELPSGIYLVRFQAGYFSAVEKMVLLK